jgi:hypothetical protein
MVLAKFPYEQCYILTNLTFPQLYIFPEFALRFYSPERENLKHFIFVVQFSEFLIQGNELSSLSAVGNGCVQQPTSTFVRRHMQVPDVWKIISHMAIL